MLSLADVFELPVVRRALPEVVVGDAALGREIRWAHVIEMPDPDDLLKGGELVLTTGLGAGADPAHQARWTASLVDQGLAALAVELGSSWRDVPPPVVAGCARAGRAGGRVPPARCGSSRSPRPCTARSSTRSSRCWRAARRSTAASPS